MLRKILLPMVLFLLGNVCAATPTPVAVPVEVVGAEFGVFDDSTAGDLILEATTVVPHRVGQRYGWIIEVRTTKRSLAVREEYRLPTPAKAAKEGAIVTESLDLPAERRRQVSQRQLVPVDGRIYGEWAIGPNEPAGRRHLQVIIEGEVAASFDYEVK